jgi:four helix bundle protein
MFELLTSIFEPPYGMGDDMTFEDLDAWKRARVLVNRIYAVTRNDTLVRDFGLCSQLQRAAVSIMTNIAEGFERTHLAEKLQFYNIARGSTGEVRSLLYVVSDNYPAVGVPVEALRIDIENMGRLTSGLIASTEKRRA